jgi:hypothetical protein
MDTWRGGGTRESEKSEAFSLSTMWKKGKFFNFAFLRLLASAFGIIYCVKLVSVCGAVRILLWHAGEKYTHTRLLLLAAEHKGINMRN